MSALQEIKNTFNDMSKEEQQEVVQGLVSVPFTFGTLHKAIKHYRRGNYVQAVFWLLMWKGFNDNLTSQTLIRRQKSILTQVKDVHIHLHRQDSSSLAGLR